MNASQDSKAGRGTSEEEKRGHFSMPGLVFIAFLTVVSFLLLFLVPIETRWFRRVPFYLQPGFQAYVVLSAMAFFSTLALIAELRRYRFHKGHRMMFLGLELIDWLNSREYAAWFVVYAISIPTLGYLPASLVFMLLLGARVGVRTKRDLAVLIVIAISTVVFFRGVLAVKMPAGAYYEHLPEPLRGTAIRAL